MTHYDTLGVKSDATADAIKTAWRRASSAAHPDREGGSTERQQVVNKAYEVLSDPERRARYDHTGDDSAGESVAVDAQQMLVALFTQAMEGDDNWLRFVSQALDAQRKHLLSVQSDAHAKRVRLTRRTGKIKAKSGENLVQMLIDNQIRQLDAQHQHIEHGLKVVAATSDLLKNYEGNEEPPAAHVFNAQNLHNNPYNPQQYQQAQGGFWSGIFGGS